MNVFQRILTAENLLFMLKGAGYSLLVAIAALAGGSILALCFTAISPIVSPS